jgi:hypothetical protein
VNGGVERTVASALGHLQGEVLGFVVFAHVVIDRVYRGWSVVRAAWSAGEGLGGWTNNFAATKCVTHGVLEERGAGEVGCKEPHEQESDSTGKDKRICVCAAQRESNSFGWPVHGLISRDGLDGLGAGCHVQ